MRLITLLLLSGVLIGCEKELPVYSGEPLRRGGILYKPNSNETLTARVERYHENGQLEILYTAIDGKKEGLQQQWYENGQYPRTIKTLKNNLFHSMKFAGF